MQPVTLAYFVARSPEAGLTPFQLLDAPNLAGETVLAVVCPGRYSAALEIGDWTFVIDQTSAFDGRPPASVLIVKYCGGSLLDHVRNLALWRRVDNPYPPQELQAWLLNYIDEAITCANGQTPSAPFFQAFARLVNDATWNGSVILNVALDACDTLPPDLSWMDSLIPDGTLVAHHIAFEAAKAATASPIPTVVSALASYPAQPNDAKADPVLNALFANSALIWIQHTRETVTIQQA